MIIIDKAKCIGCKKCINDCFVEAIHLKNGIAEVNDQKCIDCGHCIAICPEKAVVTDKYDMSEVKAYQPAQFEVLPANLLNFIKFRRTIRNFTKEKVELAEIKKIIEAGRFTPTGSNRQDLSFTVVKDELTEFRSLVLNSLKQKAEDILTQDSLENKPLRRYAKLWLQMNKQFKENPESGDKLFFGAPAIIIVSAMSEVNAALGSANMELMANALDLGVLFSGFTVLAAQDKKVRDFLEIKKTKQVVTALVIGHPAVEYYRTVPRKKAEIKFK